MLCCHLGFYTALASLPHYRMTGSPNPIYNFPGHMARIVTYRDVAVAVLTFRAPWIKLRLPGSRCPETHPHQGVRRTRPMVGTRTSRRGMA